MPPSSATALLPGLTKVSPSVYLCEPPQTAARPPLSPLNEEVCLAHARWAISGGAGIPLSPCPPPKLIILVTWMSARLPHIFKYVFGYRARYPTSRILVIRSSPSDLFYRRTNTQRCRVAPAISAVLSSCSFNSANPEIILHIFSNGGCHQSRNLFLAYSQTTSCPFPPHVTILDSCPGRASFKQSALALSSALPSFLPTRSFLLLLIYVIVGVYWVSFIPLGIPDPIERLRQFLNSRTELRGEIKRCYIYGDTDPMVGWGDVEDHARDAAGRGFKVQREEFQGTGHCAHIRLGGGKRYWAIVESLWRETQG